MTDRTYRADLTLMPLLNFTKMHGIGNDFVMVDATQPSPAFDWAEAARLVCDRRHGVGGDGLILALDGDKGLEMRMFNPDGSESEMCGNGVRCFALFARDRGLTDSFTIPVQTGAGRLVLEVLEGGRVKVDMGKARLMAGEIGMDFAADQRFVDQFVSALGHDFRGTAVSMGNPHLVLLVSDADAYPLAEFGPALEHHPLFPMRVNVHFVQVVDRGHIIQKTWERGAGATLACGTGACASAVAAFLNGRTDRQVSVSLPGGDLDVQYCEDGTVFMTGLAETVFEGEISVG